MKTWSIGRLICDTARAVKGTAALVFAPVLDVLYPPLTEPTPKVCRAHGEKVCIICDEDGDALWVNPGDGAEELAERGAEEEVWSPAAEVCLAHRSAACTVCDEEDDNAWVHPNDLDLDDEDRERIGEVDDFVPGATYSLDEMFKMQARIDGDRWGEPPLTGSELVGVRQLLEERFGDMIGKDFAGAAASLADVRCGPGGDSDSASVREDKQRDTSSSLEPVAPHTDSPARGTGQAVHPPGPPARPPTEGL
jgi:hypothetical protein